MARPLPAVLLLLVLFAQGPFLSGQSSEGTRFWCAFMENLNILFNDAPVFAIQIDAEVTTDGLITLPATGQSFPFTAPGGTITEVALPAGIWYPEVSEVVDDRGFLITTDEPVRVSAFHYRAYFTESTLLLPEGELGTEYLPTCYPDLGQSGPSSFVITSTLDGNQVEITPAAVTLAGGQPAGVPFTITLDQGEAYQVQSTGDLTGSVIRSLNDRPLAVFSGARQAIADCIGGADSHLYDQCQPVDQWEDLYYHVPFKNQGGEVVRVVASEDNTTVFFDCEVVANLNRGDFYEEKLFQATVISGTEPIAVTQFNSSQECNASNLGDPNMLRLLPITRQAQQLRWWAPGNFSGLGLPYVTNHFVNVVTATVNIADVTIDGAAITASFQPFPADPAWSYAQVAVTSGAHELASDSGPFLAYSYGFGDFDAYSTHLGYDGPTPVSFTCLQIRVEGLFCVDSLLTFSAISNLNLEDYQWDFGDGGGATGSNPSYAYDSPGFYTVALTATDSEGTVVSATLDLQIFDCPEDPCEEAPDLSIQTEGDPCSGGEVVFSFTSSVSVSSVQWDFGPLGLSDALAPTVVFPQEGNYPVVLTVFDQFNCGYQTGFTFTVPPCSFCELPPLQDIQIQGPPCVDSLLTFSVPVDLGAFPNLNVQWNFSDGQFSNENTPQVSFAAPGTYVVDLFVVDLATGCVIVGNLDFVVENCEAGDPCLDPPPLSLVLSGAFCTDSLLTITPQTDATLVNYNWTASDGSTSNAPVFSVIFGTAGVGEVTLQATDSDGCTYVEVIAFDIEACQGDPCTDLPPLTIQSDGALCTGAPVFFLVQTTADLVNFNWSFSNGVTSAAASPTLIFDNAGVVTVELTATDTNGCTYERTVEIAITSCDPCDDPPPASLIITGSFCVDSVLTFSLETEASISQYTWDLGDGITSPDPAPVRGFPAPGVYPFSLVAISAEGCAYDLSGQLTIEDCGPDCPDPSALEILAPDPACLDEGLPLTVITPVTLVSYRWDLGDGRVLTDPAPAVRYTDPGRYDGVLEAVDAAGCTYREDFSLQVLDCDCELNLPNAFSPNGDGINDAFAPLLGCIPETFFLRVYNRWGALIYESVDPFAAWDARFNGRPVDAGVYVWVVEYQFPGSPVREMKAGDVAVLR